MDETRYLDDDVVRLFELGKPRKKEFLVATLFWGDKVRVVKPGTAEIVRRVFDPVKKQFVTVKKLCALPAKLRFRDEPLLKVRFIDVGQGDGAIIETPNERIVLVDGGEEEHMRRYLNAAYSHVLRTKPLPCAAIVVTHGDADHFAGLTKAVNGFRAKDSPLLTAEHVFHNGLVKRPSPAASNAKTAFGRSRVVDGETFAVDLVDDPRDVPSAQMNAPFREWAAALDRLAAVSGSAKGARKAEGRKKRAKTKMKVARVDHLSDPFAFLNDGKLKIEALGPVTETINGKPALRMLKTPGSSGLSASHTINGHSIVLKLTFGNVRFLFGADLNEEAEDLLLSRSLTQGISLTAEILKVPHHGSADFSPRMLEAIKPVVSVVSSGDENAAKEFIHPRAGLVGALGKFSRASVDKPLVYVTEMVAFMARLGTIEMRQIKKGKNKETLTAPARIVNAYQKTAFGIVHVRTDGERVLVATHSGKDDAKESYAFHVDRLGQITFEPKTRVL